MMTRLATYRKTLLICLILWASIVAVFSVERFFMLHHFVSDDIRSRYAGDLAALFVKGLLFDIKIASVAAAFPFLIGLFGLTTQKTATFTLRLLPTVATVLFLTAFAAALGNWFYYSVYDRQFDVFVFGLAEEDTSAVLKTVWSDYPVISCLAALIAAAFVLGKMFSLIRRSTRFQTTSCGKTAWIAAILLPTLALAAGIRGSFGKFPLRQTAMQISAAPQINKLVPNALTSLSWAVNEYRNSNDFHPVSDEDGSRLISTLLDKKTNADLTQLFAQTVANAAVEKHRPNVVLTVMESMSAHLLNMDNPERDLLGELGKHWQQDWVYRKFVSEGDGTSDTLHRFFVRSPRLNLSQSLAKNKTFPSNMFKPYLDAGYRVVYITAGNGGWRDFDTFLRHLGVNEIIDENTLKTHYPEAKSETWGVPDEFMFRYAEEELARAEKSGTPVFIMMMSVTNHPPYRLPAPHQAKNFRLDEQEQKRLANLASGKELNEIFNTFRYSNDQLGHFIGKVKTIAPDTIIAATGDHNMRAIGYPESADAALGHSVPFYLYVPQAYRGSAEYHPERAGSHKDILPTLYNLSLSKSRYYQTGCNLTAPQPDSAWCGYGYNPEVIITERGFYHQHSKAFHKWDNKNIQTAESRPSTPDGEDQAIIRRASAYTPFLEWQINRIISTQ
jgi:putative phosphatidylglycerol--membrane-oligosaccharide glycerophosphotransferase